MSYMGSLLKGHNTKTLSPAVECDTFKCVNECPVNGECMKRNIIYQATITTDRNETHTYTGLSKNSFKERLTQHLSNFRVYCPKPKTTLSKKVWELKRSNTVFDVRGKIVDRAQQYTPMTKTCNLCISEIYHIIYNPKNATLNSRNELKGHCRHWEQYRLSNFKT